MKHALKGCISNVRKTHSFEFVTENKKNGMTEINCEGVSNMCASIVITLGLLYSEQLLYDLNINTLSKLTLF
jgi:hypothetical protein